MIHKGVDSELCAGIPTEGESEWIGAITRAQVQ